MGGGGDETKVKAPEWWTDAAKKALAAGEKVAKIGYVPYMGPDVAAFSPQQVDAMQQAADWSAAFMTPGQAAIDVESTLMPATDYGGGLRGYSSFGGFQDSIAALRDTYPGIYKYISSFFIDPVTGKFPGTGDPGIPGGDPNPPPPTNPPPTTPPPPPTGGDGGGGPGGGPPPPGERVPGMRGRMPNGDIWKINQKGQLVIIDATPRPGPGGEGGLGNFRSREGYAGGNPVRL